MKNILDFDDYTKSNNCGCCSSEDKMCDINELADGIYKARFYDWIFELEDGRKYKTQYGVRCSRKCSKLTRYEVKNGEFTEMDDELSEGKVTNGNGRKMIYRFWKHFQKKWDESKCELISYTDKTARIRLLGFGPHNEKPGTILQKVSLNSLRPVDSEDKEETQNTPPQEETNYGPVRDLTPEELDDLYKKDEDDHWWI